MIKKLKQMWLDHKAMQIFRKHRGDVRLVSFVGPAGEGYECWIFQYDWCEIDPDPAGAILRSFATWKQGRGGWPQ